MTPRKAKKYLKTYMQIIVPASSDKLFEQLKDIISELSKKLAVEFNDEKEIEDYLDYVFEYIDGLNQFFVKKGKGRVPYSKLFSFANKDIKIQEFKFDKNVQKKRVESNNVDVAGYNYEEEEEEEINVIYKNDIYGQIFSLNKKDFFFSIVTKRLIVRNRIGKILPYKKYKKLAIKNGIVYVSPIQIYNAILSGDNRTSTMESFVAALKKKLAKR